VGGVEGNQNELLSHPYLHFNEKMFSMKGTAMMASVYSNTHVANKE